MYQCDFSQAGIEWVLMKKICGVASIQCTVVDSRSITVVELSTVLNSLKPSNQRLLKQFFQEKPFSRSNLNISQSNWRQYYVTKMSFFLSLCILFHGLSLTKKCKPNTTYSYKKIIVIRKYNTPYYKTILYVISVPSIYLFIMVYPSYM